MASRLHKLGTIYSRVQGLLKAGAMKPENKPLWFDVYEAFPPRTAPEAMRPLDDGELNAILYPEDKIRAMYYEHFGTSGVFNLKDASYESECQKFVTKYKEIENEKTNGSAEEIFIITKERMGAELNHKDENDVVDEKDVVVKKGGIGIDITKLW